MILVPVIDLMQGQVVRAQRGDRRSYRPIVSRLCAGSDPVELARALCRHCDSRQLYAADLDALTGGEPQHDVVRAVLRAMPELELWLDAGFADAAAADTARERIGTVAQRVVPVFGSESLRSRGALQGCFAGGRDGLLSLDRRDGQRLDEAGCWEAPSLWPQRVIVMTLERVGADSGPDLDTLRAVQARSPATRLIGAGGIRDAADLALAGEAGAHAWLVASALHDGRLAAVRRAAT
ncbi:MAG TPA: HisA/HisF-related TIM barrel protein [Burkholderiaceae bacterium]|nr:HisA/HisF-related TIM barrel protein [Burkholderiaceae bacterium]